MDAEYLVEMANDICGFFASASAPAKAATEAAGHMRRQWEPRMRKQLVEIWRRDPHGLSEVARAAVAILAEQVAA